MKEIVSYLNELLADGMRSGIVLLLPLSENLLSVNLNGVNNYQHTLNFPLGPKHKNVLRAPCRIQSDCSRGGGGIESDRVW